MYNNKTPAMADVMMIIITLVSIAGSALCAYDLPLKQCSGMQISDPSWINGQLYGTAKGSMWHDWVQDPSRSFVLPTQMSVSVIPRASLHPPYSFISPQSVDQSINVAGIRKWSITADAGSPGASIYVEDIQISTSKTSCMQRILSPYDTITSGTFLGNRHIMITTDASFSSRTSIGSGTARVLLIDYYHFGQYMSCSSSTPIMTSLPSVYQIYPLMDGLVEKQHVSNARQTVFYGCHADSYAVETMASIRSNIQPFYIVCMSSDAGGNWWLKSFKLELVNSESSRDSMSDDGKFSVTTWIGATNIARMDAVTVQTYPVHVLGKRLVLYRCLMADVHWCWRKFEENLWGQEMPALTTKYLTANSLQQGMFLGWTGSEEGALPGGCSLIYVDHV